ncbi:MAG: hypothetical protein RBU21_00665 [FCB group bacterium]|jgi:hypothetical protein|nr:hypothetical protein [FCB group bacterium]
MAGRDTANATGKTLQCETCKIAENLGLEVRTEVPVGRRIWGAKRRIDVVLKDPSTRKTLGIECKYQSVPGTAEEKLPAVLKDIAAWPIRGIVVFSGPGFSENMKSYLHSSGLAVELIDLEEWIKLYFGL